MSLQTQQMLLMTWQIVERLFLFPPVDLRFSVFEMKQSSREKMRNPEQSPSDSVI